MTTTTRSPLWPGVPLALAAAVLFGATAPLSKLLLDLTDALLLAGLLYLGAGIGLVLTSLARKIIGLAQSEAPLRRAQLPLLGLISVFGGLLGPLLLMFGLMRIPAANASLLLNLEALATMTLAWLVYRENVERPVLTGAAAILAGALVVSWNGSGISFDRGSMLVAAACLCWGIDNNLSRKLSGADPVHIAAIKCLSAGSVNFVLAQFLGAQLPLASVMFSAALVGFFGIGLSLVLFMLGLRHLGSARTGAYFSLAPFIGVILAVAMLGEPLTLKIALAGVLMAIGLWLHLTERHAHEHRHQRLEHEHSHVHDAHHQHSHAGTVSEPHTHAHVHEPLRHAHPHFPDLHHRHDHQH